MARSGISFFVWCRSAAWTRISYPSIEPVTGLALPFARGSSQKSTNSPAQILSASLRGTAGMPGATTTGPPTFACFCGASPCPASSWGGGCEGCLFSALKDTNGGGVKDNKHSTPGINSGSGSSPTHGPIHKTENMRFESPSPFPQPCNVSRLHGSAGNELCLGHWCLLVPWQ